MPSSSERMAGADKVKRPRPWWSRSMVAMGASRRGACSGSLDTAA